MKAILGIFLALASLLFVFPAIAAELPRGEFEELRQTGTGTVMQVISPSVLQLKSGEFIRLSGLNFPDYSEDQAGPFSLVAIKILKDMLEGQQVVIYQTRNKAVGRVNRMGHSLAHIVRTSDGAWAQGSLLSLGLAMVQTDQGNPEMAAQMLSLEAQARTEKLSIWEQLVHILTPDETTEHTGEFSIVEGRVDSVALKNNRLFLNFGKNWKDDFTVTVSPENKRAFNKSGVNPLDWNKKILRVRGVLSELNGPNMEVDTPWAIERIDDASTAPQTPDNKQESNRDSVLPLPLRQSSKLPNYQKGIAKPIQTLQEAR